MPNPNAAVEQKRIDTEKANYVVNIKGVRRQNFPYIFIWIIYYAWVVVFATWWTSSPLINTVFGANMRSITHSVILLSSAVFVFIIRKEWFVKVSRMGAVVIIFGMVAFFIAQGAHTQLALAIILAIALGVVNIGILMPFVFVLNNTEKMLAVVGSNLLINLMLLFQRNSFIKDLNHYIILGISFTILITALSAILFFKKSSIAAETECAQDTQSKMPRRVYLTLFFNCALAILGKGAGSGILNIAIEASDFPVLLWYYAGGILGCLLFIIAYALSRKAFLWIGNITFACVAMGLLCNAFTTQVPKMVLAFAFLLGIGGTVGMINVYYIVGVVGKKYNSIRYVRFSILFVGICGGIAGVVVGNIITITNTAEMSIISSIFAAVIMLSFLMISPIFIQAQLKNDWGKDSGNMEVDNEQSSMFHRFNLSKREIEVCKLLLQGYTMRQISAMLSISYSTVNTYCTSSYRKLEINSKTELLLLFKDYVLQ